MLEIQILENSSIEILYNHNNIFTIPKDVVKDLTKFEEKNFKGISLDSLSEYIVNKLQINDIRSNFQDVKKILKGI